MRGAMRRALVFIVPAFVLMVSTQARAATIQVTSIAAGDYFDWGQVRVVDGSGVAQGVASPIVVTSNLGRTGTLTDGVAFTGLIEGPDSDWTGNFLVGENVLVSADNPNLF